MCVLKTGFLFVAAEFGNHCLYQIARLGEEDEEPEFSSAIPLEEGDTFFFAPRALRNLLPVEELDSLSPAMGCTIADLANEDTPQLYVACGRGPRSCVRVLRHGLEVSEMAVSELPGNPNAVWTVKRKADEDYDAYIIVSFVNATLVLSIGETVEEVTDSGFLGTTPTLSCAQIGDDALVQTVNHSQESKPAIAKRHAVPKCTLLRIEKVYNSSAFAPCRKRICLADYEGLEEVFFLWFKHARSSNLPVTRLVLEENARDIALQMGILKSSNSAMAG
ncbi:hypothetical protein HPB50_025039 [Hyalomma asiaticum]|uniref:Uncharacterized protein n=1 Tax=Hyalomma asiaticum TaxID=266040 RepID=A0ACB7TQU6_HYAAI|nr:hypothetical protein HPB50_025039 [Hyalomma asiaticum]